MLKQLKIPRINMQKIFRTFLNVILVLIGTLLASIALQSFLIPNKIIDGGVTGISLLLDYATPQVTWLSFPVLIVAFNIPFLILGYKHMGGKFVFLSIISIVSLAIMQLFLVDYNLYLTDPLLAAIFGGIILGIGVGIVLKNNGSLDGIDILSMYISRSIPFSVGEIILAINLVIFSVAIFVLGVEEAMYSIITYFIVTKSIDIVIQGLGQTKVVFIVSKRPKAVTDAILYQLNRGTTILNGKGAFSREEKSVLYVVVSRLEITKLKTLLHDIDPDAFFTIMDTSETKGGQLREKTIKSFT